VGVLRLNIDLLAEEITARILNKMESNDNVKKYESIVIEDTSPLSSLLFRRKSVEKIKNPLVIDSKGHDNSTLCQYMDNADNLYILALGLSNAAKICSFSDDTAIPFLVQYALLTGKNVFVEDVYSDVDTIRANGMYMNEVIKLMNKLESYGIRVIRSRIPENIAVEEKSDGKLKERRRLVSMEDVKNIDKGFLEVESGAIITPLAKDYLKDKGIKIIRK
jgi:hypothetical protein